MHARQLLTLTSLMGSLLLPLSAQAQVPAGVKLAAKQELTLTLPQSPNTIDPTFINFVQEFKSVRPVFDTLTRLDNTGKYVPVAAQSWEVSEDGLTWTFHLRPQAKWQDGKPVTAQDFVYSWQRLTDPKTAASMADYLANTGVVNAREVYEGKLPPIQLGVKALDDYTLQVSLLHPVPWFEQIVSAAVTAPLRKDIIDKYGEQWTQAQNIIGNGPYKIASYRFNEQMVYQKWDGYWDAKNVHLTRVTYEYIKDPLTQYYRYLEGEYLVSEIPAQYQELVQKERPNEVIKVLTGRTAYMEINPHRFADHRILEAFSLVVDRNLLTRQILRANIPTTAFAPPYLSDLQDVKQQPWISESQAQRNARATELLAQAGYTRQKPLVITLTQNATRENERLYVALANILSRGTNGAVQLKQNPLEAAAYFGTFRNTNYDMVIKTWGMDYSQASTLYNIFLSNSAYNSVKWKNPEYDRLVLTANQTLDDQERAKLYAQANEILLKDSPYAPLWYVETLMLKKPELQGYYTGLALNYFRDMYIVDLKAK
ncbi:hypothetical protein CJP74_02600 [Psittacicella melopsittaci]|uniref:Solute-binding protein family 5 domain-containing protein n=1 Tax=Psittacicella melopsittaci TaxID=2028576 RepID=A0A3A1YAH8_9GAMM|nr:peptide ABC transporter substrate-binding protein [Psittacicella melopsittaci]RIY33164.1 hypothetical protein CJP74_02600 [Psittacicella melopsittaci]